MPREQINYPDLTQKAAQRELRTHQGHDLAEHDFEPWNESAVHVGWQGGEASTDQYGVGWVQVGLEVDLDYAKFALSSPNGVDKSRTVMYSPVLSLAEVDRMIAMLKRARRKAFKQTATH